MGAMVVDSNILWGLVGLSILLVFCLLAYHFRLKNTCPEAAVIMKARAKKIPIIMYHYPNNVVKLVFPQLEEKVEDIANYFRADGVYKFWDSTGQNYERLNGDLTLYHVLSNVPDTVSHKIAAVMSQVEAFLKNSGYPIDGMQDLFFYVLSEVEKEVTVEMETETMDENGIVTIVPAPDQKRKKSLDEILSSISLDDKETTTRVKESILFLQAHRNEFEELIPYFRPVPFSFQTMVRSWDNLMAFTSKNFMQAKTIIEIAAKREQNMGRGEILMYAFGTVIVLAGMVFLFKGMGWS